MKVKVKVSFKTELFGDIYFPHPTTSSTTLLLHYYYNNNSLSQLFIAALPSRPNMSAIKQEKGEGDDFMPREYSPGAPGGLEEDEWTQLTEVIITHNNNSIC